MTTWVIGTSGVLWAVKGDLLSQGWFLVGLLVLAVFAKLLLLSWLTLRLCPQRSRGHRRKALVGSRLGARGANRRARRRSRLPSRVAPRRHPLRLLALAIPHPQNALGHHCPRQNRLHLCSRRRAAVVGPNARPHRGLQLFSRCPPVSGWRRIWRRIAVNVAASEASCAKGCTPSTRPRSSSLPRSVVSRAAASTGSAGGANRL